MYCGKCGAKTKSGNSFCVNCGNQITESEENTPALLTPTAPSEPAIQQIKLSRATKKKLKIPIVVASCVVVAAAIAIFVILNNAGHPANDNQLGNSVNSDDRGNREVSGNPGDENSIGNNTGISGGGNHLEPGFWPETIPDERTVESALWEFSIDDIAENETLLSVSPSGKHILTSDRISIPMDISGKGLASGIPNRLGWQVDHISIYTETNGTYTQTSRMDINYDTSPAFNDTVAVCRENSIAWSEDETRALITIDLSFARSYFGITYSDIYLVDFNKQTFENLTGYEAQWVNTEAGGYHHLLPQWADNDNIRYICYEQLRGFLKVSLMNMNLNMRTQEILSDLSAGGRNILVYDYAIYDDSVYYSVINTQSKEASGFYVGSLDGGTSQPSCLISWLELREDNIHPYIITFSSVQISKDGRWACLIACDNRGNFDFPMADGENVARQMLGPNATKEEIAAAAVDYSQPDPNNARSMVTHRPWIPCHNVLLYDLVNNKLVNPFVAETLQPDVVVVMAADFAPDGKSLLCLVLGDGGPWVTDSFFFEATLYQICLDDGQFHAMRISKTELLYPDSILYYAGFSWLENNSLLIGYGHTPYSPEAQIMIPAAFERFSNSGSHPEIADEFNALNTFTPQLLNLKVGDEYEMGGYEWQVLAVRDGKALLLSKYVIDFYPYYDFSGYEGQDISYLFDIAEDNPAALGICWAKSSVRRYLNNDFYNNFSADERTRIVEAELTNRDNPDYGTDGGPDTLDYIFLLSYDEVIECFGDSIVKSDQTSRWSAEALWARFWMSEEKVQDCLRRYSKFAKDFSQDWDPYYIDIESWSIGVTNIGLEETQNAIQAYRKEMESDGYSEESIERELQHEYYNRSKTVWMLRTPGSVCLIPTIVSNEINTRGWDYMDLGVRPAMWISLD